MANQRYLNSIGTYNTHYPNGDAAYIGQSYVPLQSEWLPLPGVNRRRLL